ncbi:MAG: prepilin-type N-terminal cleavage/methylation domain-containing protein [Solobacterium sp.]|jgi:prepilin-type N-terminal cleavage/methylation domain-containing protein|nr:prepilin-type N-terminal cleavage/methylation domain-containing protein [Solobacterium sp.]MCH4221766.1 prepilin-type N-terminal cleavage/methylation domain-containing protein [Solobacterium sp.]MCH4266237.1 prepilin-type N-terminal cleavage/methylation domain-containing protein [Solobacterium sp.]
MKGRNPKKGFTLAELLITVAIIAVLVAVSIPIFTSQLKKSRAAACSANRRSLKSLLSAQYLSGELTAADITKELISLNSKNGYQYEDQTFSCPDGGTIYAQINDQSIAVRCTYHDDKQQDEVINDTWTADTAQQIWNILSDSEREFGNADSFGSGGGQNTIKLNTALDAAGINLNDLGAVSWHYQDGSNFVWTTADISKKKAGDTVIMMKYNLSGDYAGVYSVWEATVKSVTSDRGITYNIISADTAKTEKTKSMSRDDKKDIRKVIAEYNRYAEIKLKQ